MTAEGWDHQYVELAGVRYHYVRAGQGPLVLLVHGWPGFWYEWHRVIPALAERFTAVAPDMRGFAYSDKPDLPPEEGYTDVVMAGDLAALLDALGQTKADVITHDFGAVWVQRFAWTFPTRLRRLLLMDPPYPGIGRRWFAPAHLQEVWYQLFHQLPLAEELVGSSPTATAAYLRHFLSHWSGDAEWLTPQVLEEFVRAFSQPGALRAGFNCYRAAFATRGRGAFAAEPVQQPTLVLWGTQDPILPYEWSDNLGQHFSNVKLERVEGGGHFLQLEQPDLVVDRAVRFFTRG